MYPKRTVERRGYLERVLCAPIYPCAVTRMKMCPRGIFGSIGWFYVVSNSQSRAHIFQYLFQCVLTACVAPDHICVASARLFHRAPHHLMGHCVCKQYDQIRTSYLFAKTCGHLCEYFCFTVESLTDFFVLTYHPVVTAYDNNTHIKPPAKSKLTEIIPRYS